MNFLKYHRWMVGLLGTFILSEWLSPNLIVMAATKNTTQNPLGSPVSAWLNLIIALVVVIGLAILTIRFLAKRANVQQKGSIQVLAARQLAPNKSVQVVEVQGKRYLVGVGDQITLLADVTETYVIDEEVRNASNTSEAFGTALGQALQTVRNRYRSGDSGEDKS